METEYVPAIDQIESLQELIDTGAVWQMDEKTQTRARRLIKEKILKPAQRTYWRWDMSTKELIDAYIDNSHVHRPTSLEQSISNTRLLEYIRNRYAPANGWGSLLSDKEAYTAIEHRIKERKIYK